MYSLNSRAQQNPPNFKEFAAKEKLEIVLSAPVPANQSGRQGEARRAEGGCGGNSARRAQSVPFGYFQTDTAA